MYVCMYERFFDRFIENVVRCIENEREFEMI
jgi:hypothetical protein